MGKRKSKIGMAGISRFVNVFTENQVEMQAGPTSFEPGNLMKSAIQRNDDSRESKDNTVSKLVSNVDQQKLGNELVRYDVTGLVPFYDTAAQVPEHLQKCALFHYIHFSGMFSDFPSNQRFFPAITLFFTLRQAAGVPP